MCIYIFCTNSIIFVCRSTVYVIYNLKNKPWKSTAFSLDHTMDNNCIDLHEAFKTDDEYA